MVSNDYGPHQCQKSEQVQLPSYPTPSQHLHATAQASGVRPMRVFSAHNGFPLKQHPPESARPRLKLQALPRAAKPSWYMRHIWPYLGMFAPLRMAVRRRQRRVQRQYDEWERDWLCR